MLRGIHKLCDKANWEEAKQVLYERPAIDAASRPAGRGNWTPLHLACKRGPPLDIVITLIDAAHSATRKTDSYQRLPIHYAAEKGPQNVLNALFNAHPASICEVDHEGRTPLHLRILASRKEVNANNRRPPPTREEIDILLDKNGIVAKTADSNGNLPLHFACDNIDDWSEETLKILVMAHVKAVLEVNVDGHTPLHKALLTSVPNLGHIQILMAINEVARMEDSAGRLPLHCACQNFVPYNVLEEIVKIFNGAAAIQTSDGRYPLEIFEDIREEINSPEEMKEFNRKSDLIFAYHPHLLPFRNDIDRLERCGMTICDEIDEKKVLSESSLLIWKWMTTMSEENDPELLHYSIVASIVRSLNAQSARILASMELPGGAVPSTKCIRLLRSYLRFADKYELDISSCTKKNEKSLVVKARDYPEEEGDIYKKGASTHYRNVLIKFMSVGQEFFRETHLHTHLILNDNRLPPVIPILETFDVSKIGRYNNTGAAYKRDIESFTALDLRKYSYALVKPETGESLKSTLSNYDIEMFKIKEYLKQIANALECLHSNCIFYGEIDLSSIVSLNDSLVFSDFGGASSSGGNYYGSVFRSGNLPPEMIAKLNASEVKMYHRYWKSTLDDASVTRMFLPQDLAIITEKVDSFLIGDKEQHPSSSFSCLWGRMKRSSKIWKRIRPRCIDGHYYTIKCFRKNEDGLPCSTLQLPFDLVPSSSSIDIWMFANVMYEMCSGETLFPVNQHNDLVKNGDFKEIFNWDNWSDYAAEKYELIQDPLARDLLRELLVYYESRPQVSEILLHPFFICDVRNKMLESFSLDVIQREEEYKRRKEEEAWKVEEIREKKKLEEEWLQEKTRTVTLITQETHLKMHCSTWRQWKCIYTNLQESVFPMCYVLLPYELMYGDGNENEVVLSDKDLVLAEKMALLFGNLLQAATFAKEIGDNVEKIDEKNNSKKLSEFSDMNRAALAYAESKVVDICEGIVIRANNAEIVLSDVLSGLVNDEPVMARVLVRDTLQEIVNLEVCKEIARKAKDASEAFQSAFKPFLGLDVDSSMQMVNEKYEDILGKDFCSESISHKMDAERALYGLIKDYVENPVAASKRLLKLRIEELAEFLVEARQFFFYMVDEITGYPVSSDFYPCEIESAPELLRILLPGLHMSLKTCCANNLPLALSRLVGLKPEQTCIEWRTMAKFTGGGFEMDEVKDTFLLVEDAVGQVPFLGIEHIFQIENFYSQYEQFVHTIDPERDYAGLYRICGPGGLLVWTTSGGEAEMKASDVIGLDRLASKKKKDAFDFLEKLWSEDCVLRKMKPKGLKIWSKGDTISAENLIENPPEFQYHDESLPDVAVAPDHMVKTLAADDVSLCYSTDKTFVSLLSEKEYSDPGYRDEMEINHINISLDENESVSSSRDSWRSRRHGGSSMININEGHNRSSSIKHKNKPAATYCSSLRRAKQMERNTRNQGQSNATRKSSKDNNSLHMIEEHENQVNENIHFQSQYAKVVITPKRREVIDRFEKEVDQTEHTSVRTKRHGLHAKLGMQDRFEKELSQITCTTTIEGKETNPLTELVSEKESGKNEVVDPFIVSRRNLKSASPNNDRNSTPQKSRSFKRYPAVNNSNENQNPNSLSASRIERSSTPREKNSEQIFEVLSETRKKINYSPSASTINLSTPKERNSEQVSHTQQENDFLQRIKKNPSPMSSSYTSPHRPVLVQTSPSQSTKSVKSVISNITKPFPSSLVTRVNTNRTESPQNDRILTSEQNVHNYGDPSPQQQHPRSLAVTRLRPTQKTKNESRRYVSPISKDHFPSRKSGLLSANPYPKPQENIIPQSHTADLRKTGRHSIDGSSYQARNESPGKPHIQSNPNPRVTMRSPANTKSILRAESPASHTKNVLRIESPSKNIRAETVGFKKSIIRSVRSESPPHALHRSESPSLPHNRSRISVSDFPHMENDKDTSRNEFLKRFRRHVDTTRY